MPHSSLTLALHKAERILVEAPPARGRAPLSGLFLMSDLPDLGMGQRVQNSATGVRMTITTGGHIHTPHVCAALTC